MPGKLNTFTLEQLASYFGPDMDVKEAHPPVADLLKRDMSITVIGRKH